MDFYPKEAEMKYCGIDLHSNNSVVVVSDEEDRIVFSKRLPNDLAQILARLPRHLAPWLRAEQPHVASADEGTSEDAPRGGA